MREHTHTAARSGEEGSVTRGLSSTKHPSSRHDKKSDKISIVVVDDLTLYREGLQEILARERDLEVVDQAGDANEGLIVVGRHQPQVLLDVEMPGHHIKRSVPRFLRESPRTRIIALTMYDDPRLANQMISPGARAYLVKNATRADLLSVVRGVCALTSGGSWSRCPCVASGRSMKLRHHR